MYNQLLERGIGSTMPHAETGKKQMDHLKYGYSEVTSSSLIIHVCQLAE